MRVIAILELLIIRHTAEKRSIFHIYSLVINSDIEFVHEIYLNYKFNEFKNYQQLNLIEKILNEDYFENFIIKVVMFNNNVQKLSIIFLKTVILLLADL